MAFLGMRGTGDWGANERPENWRKTLLFFYPNGDMPLTGITSMITPEPTDDPHFHWFTKTLPKQAGEVTNVYTDVALANAYSGNNYASGSTVFVKAAESVISEFRVGHTVKLRKQDDYRYDTSGEVTDRVINGAGSYVAVKLHEATSATYDLEGVDYIMVTGNGNAEGADMPDAVGYDPQEFDNYSQIFRTPLSITRTSRKTRYRTGDKYQEDKRETLELHGIEMEKAIIWGVKYSTIGSNNKPKRYSDGLINFINTYASDNVDDFAFNSNFSGDTWLQSGEDWLDAQLEKIYRRGRSEKLSLVGSTTLRAINQLAKVSGDINLEPMSASYGLQVVRWITPYGPLYLKLHPLFSHEPTNRRSMLIIEPEKIKPRPLDDTMFIEDPQDRKNRNHSKDATEEEYLTELGWEYHEPLAMGYLNGFGLDNAV